MEASYHGFAWMPMDPTNMFGDHCHSTADMRAIAESNEGAWPKVADFNVEGWLQNLSPESKRYAESNPWACISVPEAFPCYATRGNDGESGSKNDPACAP